MRIYGRSESNRWHRVRAMDAAGCRCDAAGMDFPDAWNASAPEPDGAPTITRAWNTWCAPIPWPDIVCWAYAMTYGSHRREVRLRAAFRFRKMGPLIRVPPVTRLRPGLDYEGEIGVLLHRDSPDRYGYVMVNDLTDRGLQVRHYSRRDRAAGFERAKHFEQSLQVGPLIAIGSAADWDQLRLTVHLNGELRQTVDPRHCRIDPARVRAEIVADHPDDDWILVCTGTPEGIIFRSPALWQKLGLLLRSGLNTRRARERWLARFAFLADGDVLEMRSDSLGRASTVFRADPGSGNA